jgi:hypothetical protein
MIFLSSLSRNIADDIGLGQFFYLLHHLCGWEMVFVAPCRRSAWRVGIRSGSDRRPCTSFLPGARGASLRRSLVATALRLAAAGSAIKLAVRGLDLLPGAVDRRVGLGYRCVGQVEGDVASLDGILCECAIRWLECLVTGIGMFARGVSMLASWQISIGFTGRGHELSVLQGHVWRSRFQLRSMRFAGFPVR